MKHILLIMALLISFPAFAEEEESKTLTYMDHEKLMNKIFCRKAAECGEKVDMKECLTRLDGVSTAKYFNRNVIVLRKKSKECLTWLAKQDCKVINQKSISGPCSLSELR